MIEIIINYPGLGSLMLSAVRSQDQFLVTWTDTRASMTRGDDIYGQRVSPTGTLTGSAITIADNANKQASRAIAYDSTADRFLVVWQEREWEADEHWDWDLYGQLIATTGSPIVLPIAQATLEQAYTASGYPEEYEPTDARAAPSAPQNDVPNRAPGPVDQGPCTLPG